MVRKYVYFYFRSKELTIFQKNSNNFHIFSSVKNLLRFIIYKRLNWTIHHLKLNLSFEEY